MSQKIHAYGQLAACCLSSLALGVVARHDVPDAKLLQFGAKFPAVGEVLPEGGCTLIAPKWAATTAHAASLIPKTGGLVRFEGKEYGVAKVFMHPHAKKSPNEPPDIDFALILLAEEVKGITPLAIYKAEEEVGKTVAIVGYGEIGDGKSKPRRAEGKRRAVTNVVTDAGPLRLFCKFDEPPAGTDLEGIVGPGDSGAPALVQEGGAWLLAGISTTAEGLPGRYGTIDVYTRVRSYVQWIDTIMSANK